MTVLVDANLLLYAYDADSPHHAIVRQWLKDRISSGHPVRFALVTLLAFVRIASDSRIFVRPMSPAEACTVVASLLDAANVQMLAPGPRSWRHLGEICTDASARGPLVMDAHLAALAREHGAVIATADRDFRRFTGIETTNPLNDDARG
ncbi:MAG: PIN domain-containing protein [Bryobacterales bacterium]|nr:PIN domain-containing protein [Bryobacterales bacterium]